jgi:hypothetical protein
LKGVLSFYQRSFMKRIAIVTACWAACVGGTQAQESSFNPSDNTLTIPAVRVRGGQVTYSVGLRLDADGRFSVVSLKQNSDQTTNTGGSAGTAGSLQGVYVPQANYQYWYNAQGQRQLAQCSNLAQAKVTLKWPATASAQNKVPLVIALAGWAPSGSPPAPVGLDTELVDQLVATGLAAATLEYRGCDNWSSPLVVRTNQDESFETATSDFALGLAAIKALVAQQGAPVDTSRVVAAGTSFSSNLIFTVATKHQLQGGIAINGGCDYACQSTGTTYAQPNDFRVNGVAIPVAAASGATDTLFPPNGLGTSGYGAHAARTRLLGAIAEAAKKPAAFYTYVDPQVGHVRSAAIVEKVARWAQCMTGMRPSSDCAADDR